ncbi:MAG: glycosyltransferase family 2 protein [Bacteroidetes bacterium]|nr:glycosyltransferase family 2 protein [Bacteroidota bacterium]
MNSYQTKEVTEIDDFSFDISVIVPVYNAVKYVKQSIESVLAQPEVKEVIVVDDGSSDGSYELCLSIASEVEKVILLTHENRINKGVAATRNLGILKASCFYISFLDSDDYYLPHRFKKTKQVFYEHPDCDGVYELIQGQADGIIDEERAAHYNNHKMTYLDDTAPEDLFFNLYPMGKGRGFFSPDGVTFKKSIFKKTGLFDVDMKTCEDLLMWCKMAAVGRLYPGEREQPVTIFRRYDGSLTSNKSSVNKSFVMFSDKMLKFVPKYLKTNQFPLFIDRYYFMQLHYRGLYYPKELSDYLKSWQIFLSATFKIIKYLDKMYLFKKDFYRQLLGIIKIKKQ